MSFGDTHDKAKLISDDDKNDNDEDNDQDKINSLSSYDCSTSHHVLPVNEEQNVAYPSYRFGSSELAGENLYQNHRPCNSLGSANLGEINNHCTISPIAMSNTLSPTSKEDEAPAPTADDSSLIPTEGTSNLDEMSSTQHSFMKRLRFVSSGTGTHEDVPDSNSSLAVIGPLQRSSQASTTSENANFTSGQSTTEAVWEMNYHEAAIFLHEGEDNDKFDSHPSQRSALPAYLLSHSPWIYSLDLFASLLLLCLAAAERPALEIFKDMNEVVHAAVEVFALFVLGISIVLQLKWRGWRRFCRHTRSVIKCGAWVVMVAEAVTVIIRNTSHFRATRALRPIFLLDSRYLGGVRRFMRQLLQSVPPVLEVMAVLVLVLAVFTTLGYYLFSPHKEDPYFTTVGQSFVSLFVLLTSANYPDVMMPSYARCRWSAAFFILYLAITLYCIMNFMTAIVFVVFSGIEKDKFRKLLLHKRRACQHAFRLLVSRSCPDAVSYDHFTGLLKYYKPKAKTRDVYLIFKALNKSGTGQLSLNEFYQVYIACGLRWRPSDPEPPWYSHLPEPGPAVGAAVRKMVTSPVWEALVYLVICSNGIELMVVTFLASMSGDALPFEAHVSWFQLAFIAFYCGEVLFKLLGLGLSEYFSSGWNVFDLTVTLLSIAGVLAEIFYRSFHYVVILRLLRLLRLFRIRRRYREVFETMVLLAPRVMSACVVIVLIYYFFAIIGMEMFSKYDLRNCCVNSTVEQYYKFDNDSAYQNYYYLNNFDNIFMAGVTLFELTVVNNWFIIMEGYAYVSGEASRIFFMLFYMVMMVVMSVVLAFIIEAFTFRMQYNQTVNKHRAKPKSEVTRVQLSLCADEVEFIYRDAKDTRSVLQYAHDCSRQQGSERLVHYIGVGVRSKTALQLRMYRHLLHSWIKDAQHSGPERRQRSRETTVETEVAADMHVGGEVSALSPAQSGRTDLGAFTTNDGEVETWVSVSGETRVVSGGEDAAEELRKRTGSIASNLLEWWKSESGEGVPEEDEEEEEMATDAIWGIDEEEMFTKPVLAARPTASGTSRVIVNNLAEDINSGSFTTALQHPSSSYDSSPRVLNGSSTDLTASTSTGYNNSSLNNNSNAFNLARTSQYASTPGTLPPPPSTTGRGPRLWDEPGVNNIPCSKAGPLTSTPSSNLQNDEQRYGEGSR